MISVVALVPARHADVSVSAATLPVERATADVVAQVRWMAEPFGARVDELADGTVLAVLLGSGPATDTAAHAARVALRVRRVVPSAPLVLLMARGEEGERLPMGEVLERAASLLTRVEHEVPTSAGAAIVIDASTRALLDMRFQVAEVQGLSCLQGESEEVTGVVRTLLGRPTPFVGREREISQVLRLVTEGIEEKRATSVVVVGAAAIGKSRLRQEIVIQLRKRFPNIALAIGRGDSVSAGSPMSLLASAFRSPFGFSTGEPIEQSRARLSAAVSAFVAEGERQRVTEFLGELLGIAFPDENSVKLRSARQNATIMAEQIQSAYVEFSRSVARVRPAVLFLEDLQWGDGASIKLIDVVLRELEDLPWIVVAFGRPEVHTVFPRLWSERSGMEVRLSGLSRRASETLVREALGRSLNAEILTRVVAHAIEGLARVLPYQGLLAATALTQIRLRQGRPEDAWQIASSAVEKIRAMGMSHHLCNFTLHLAYAEAGFACGHEEKARQTISTLRDHIMERANRIADSTVRSAFLRKVPANARVLKLAQSHLLQ